LDETEKQILHCSNLVENCANNFTVHLSNQMCFVSEAVNHSFCFVRSDCSQ